MPFTPFHFGPGALLHASAPKHVSFLGFCAANVLIDFESLYNLVLGHHPVHAFFHTYVGATPVIGATILLFLALRGFASRYWLPNFFAWRELTARQVAIGATLGAYSHVLLDSIMHADSRPFSPFSQSNPLLAWISIGTLHLACVAFGVIGIAVLAVRRFVKLDS